MNDDELKRLFDAQDTGPSRSGREHAMAAAMAAFDEAQEEKNPVATQGSAVQPRPTPERNPHGSKIMNILTAQKPFQRWVYSAMASAAVLVLGVYIAVQLPQHSGIPDARDETGTSRVARDLEENAVVAGRAMPELREQAEREIYEAGPSAAQPVAVPEPSAQFYQRKAEIAANIAPAEAARSTLSGLAADAQPYEPAPPPYYQDVGRDRFDTVEANPVKRVADEPVSTFSIDVDTASYSFVRRELNRGVLPQKAAVRLEEMVNYFPYDYPLPADRSRPFSTDVAVIDSPWKAGNKLVRIGIQGYELTGARPHTNLVFLLDVSGSMNSPDKLPLVKQSMNLLLAQLQPEDTVAIVVYAGAAGAVLEPTPAKDKQKIIAALDRLQAGGSTAGAAGIQLAYQLAEANFVQDGVNRIVLATDGDFNVGINNLEELKGFVERKRASGVFLSVLGFGQGNYNDSLMQALAQNGNGVAAYIDTLGEAQKVLVDEATSSLFPIAKDVKIQVEFNPATVSEYRLLGYETRALAEEDFNNDAVDAGDIGAGHSVTALYEITPAGSDSAVFSSSRYREATTAAGKSDEYGFLRLRYKLPEEDASRLIEQPIGVNTSATPLQLRETGFAAAVAGFAQLLQGGKYTGAWSYTDALQLAQENRGKDAYGYRAEFVQLVRKAETAAGM